MEILIQNSQKSEVNLERIQSLARKLLSMEGCSDAAEVSIVLTDDDEIAMLNKQYRGIEGPTDVLSFSQVEMGEGEQEFADESEEHLLGDIVISVPTAERQAAEAGHSAEHEINVLVAHGLLHLLGYDHAEPEEEKEMFARQDEILRDFESV